MESKITGLMFQTCLLYSSTEKADFFQETSLQNASIFIE